MLGKAVVRRVVRIRLINSFIYRELSLNTAATIFIRVVVHSLHETPEVRTVGFGHSHTEEGGGPSPENPATPSCIFQPAVCDSDLTASFLVVSGG